jgi:aminomethyltransferase
MAARTPLYDRHVAAGARMTEFAGFDMPLQYTSIREEHLAVRRRAGLFDLSHMGEVRITGGRALDAVQRLLSNDVARAGVGAAIYSVMCNDSGGIVDDVVAYHDPDGYMIVVNASRRETDLAWMREHLDGASLEDLSDQLALLAVQGPRATAIVQAISPTPVADIAPFHFVDSGDVAGVHAAISRTGYTGEDGFELYVDAANAPSLWDAVLEAGSAEGLQPCGLGARDTLRLEAGLRLYGQDMDESTDPYSCGLGWTVKRDKGDFIGRGALMRIDPKRPPHRFIGLRLPGRVIARHGHPVLADGRVVGEVTSGTFSFTLGCGIATASTAPDVSDDAPMFIDVRGAAVAAERTPLPFYRRPKGNA